MSKAARLAELLSYGTEEEDEPKQPKPAPHPRRPPRTPRPSFEVHSWDAEGRLVVRKPGEWTTPHVYEEEPEEV